MTLYVVTTYEPRRIVTPEFTANRIGKMQFIHLLFSRYVISAKEKHPLFFITDDKELEATIGNGRKFDFEFSKWTHVNISEEDYTKGAKYFEERNLSNLMEVWTRVIGNNMYCVYSCLDPVAPKRKDFLSALLFDLIEINKGTKNEVVFNSVNFCVHVPDVGIDSNIPILGREIFAKSNGALDHYSNSGNAGIEKLRTFHHNSPCWHTLNSLVKKNDQEFQHAFLDIFDSEKKTKEWQKIVSNF